MVLRPADQVIVQAGVIHLLLHQAILLQVLLPPVHLQVEAVVAAAEEVAVEEEVVNLLMLKSI